MESFLGYFLDMCASSEICIRKNLSGILKIFYLLTRITREIDIRQIEASHLQGYVNRINII